jgi:multisubunit Na+/H+ antiporter MnhB subunit
MKSKSDWEMFSAVLHIGIGGVSVGLLALIFTKQLGNSDLRSLAPLILAVCAINMAVFAYNVYRKLNP